MKPVYKKIIFGLLLATILLPILYTAPAKAQNVLAPPRVISTGILDTVTAPIENFFLDTLDAVRGLLAYLTTTLAQAIRWMIDYGTTVVDFPVVKAGFDVSLSFVNLLFVMALIIIAFEIILQYHEHEAKKMLGKLILAALLVNFSLLISGFLLDFSNVFTHYFLSGITPDRLGAALNPQAFINISLANLGSNPGFFSILAATLFSLIMTGLVFIIFLTVFVMATVRNVIVAGLLLVMPLTWGMWVFPRLHEHHSKWWESFIKYGVAYLPSVTFFIWLAIATASQVGQATATLANNPATVAALTAPGQSTSWLVVIIGPLIQFTLVVGIMIFGLKAAHEAGAGAHSIAMGISKGIGKEIYGFNRTVGYGKYKVNLGAQSTVMGAGRGLSNVLNSRALNWLPGMKTATNKLAGLAKRSDVASADQKQIASKLTDAQLRTILKRGPVGNVDAATAYLEEGSARHMLSEIKHDDVSAWVAAAKKANPGTDLNNIKSIKDLIAHDPNVAALALDQKSGMSNEQFLNKQSEAIIKAIRKASPDDVRQWSPETIAQLSKNKDTYGVDHFLELSNGQIKAFSKSSSESKDAALAALKTIEKKFDAEGAAAGPAVKRIAEYFKRNPSLQIENDYEAPPANSGGGGSTPPPASSAGGKSGH